MVKQFIAIFWNSCANFGSYRTCLTLKPSSTRLLGGFVEGSGPYSGIQYNKDEHLADFWKRKHDQMVQPCILPVGDLPRSYRNALDKGVTTGWRSLDNYLQGLRAGEMTVITADTGAGKTTFCTQLMVNCAMQGIPVWINSWEMKPETTMRKLASVVLRRPMKFQNFTDHENEQFDEWCSRYRVYINPNTIGTDINSLAHQLHLAKQLGVQVVMLDHLDYLVNSHKEKLHEAIDETVKRLHELAFDLSMHFLLICHPRQSGTSGEEVGIHSLKGSSSIKQYADNVIVLHRCARTDASSDPNKVKIRVAKNRMFGTEGNTYLFYQPTWDGYMEMNP
jgi:replicative DNA helicase